MPESKVKTLSSSGSGPELSASLIEQNLDDVDDFAPGQVPVPGSVISGKYRVERLIARGGMGAVFAASHTVSGKKVALKWMLPALGQIKGARERFIREACATARIAHPNIVDIYDVGAENASVYLVMEYLRGETLSDRLAHSRPNAAETIALLMPAFRGVAAAHSHGVIHRDLKPDNIFLCCTETGDELEPKVLDFGISKITSDEARDLALTHSGAVLGTPYYMSPEQVRGARDVDERADVYAFGVIMFEMLAGQRPFDAETYNQLILKIATEAAPKLAEFVPQLDPALIAVIERAMASDLQQRFGSIEALALALEPFGEGVRYRTRNRLDRLPASGDYPVGTMSRTPSALSFSQVPAFTAQRRTRVTVAAATFALLAGAGTLVFLSKTTPTPAAAAASLSAATRPEAEEPEAAQVAQPRPSAPALPTQAAPQLAEETKAELPEAALAQEALVVEPASDVNTDAQPATARNAASRNVRSSAATTRSLATKTPARSSRDRAQGLGLPPPEPSPAAPVVSKHAGAKDWDDRLSTEPLRAPANTDIPAGAINTRDFR
jgi:serine/threonine-protein kinase